MAPSRNAIISATSTSTSPPGLSCTTAPAKEWAAHCFKSAMDRVDLEASVFYPNPHILSQWLQLNKCHSSNIKGLEQSEEEDAATTSPTTINLLSPYSEHQYTFGYLPVDTNSCLVELFSRGFTAKDTASLQVNSQQAALPAPSTPQGGDGMEEGSGVGASLFTALVLIPQGTPVRAATAPAGGSSPTATGDPIDFCLVVGATSPSHLYDLVLARYLCLECFPAESTALWGDEWEDYLNSFAPNADLSGHRCVYGSDRTV